MISAWVILFFIVVFKGPFGKKYTSSWMWPFLHCSLESSSALFCLTLFYLILFSLSDLGTGQEVVQCLFQISKERPNIKWCNRSAERRSEDGKQQPSIWTYARSLTSCCSTSLPLNHRDVGSNVGIFDGWGTGFMVIARMLLSMTLWPGWGHIWTGSLKHLNQWHMWWDLVHSQQICGHYKPEWCSSYVRKKECHPKASCQIQKVGTP